MLGECGLLSRTNTSELLRTWSYVSVTFGFIILGGKKSSAAAAADVAMAATTAAVAAAAAAAVGHTRPGSAWLYARLLGLTLGPFAHVLDVCCVFPGFPSRNSA